MLYYILWRLKLATNLQKFNRALQKSTDKIHGDMNLWYKTVILEVLRRIVLRTPVDTGRARGNWQVEIGSAASGTLEVTGSTGEMASFAINSGAAKLSLIPAFSLVHITNNLEYISYLEYDKRSPQFPEGMVEITLTEMANWVSSIK